MPTKIKKKTEDRYTDELTVYVVCNGDEQLPPYLHTKKDRLKPGSIFFEVEDATGGYGDILTKEKFDEKWEVE